MTLTAAAVRTDATHSSALKIAHVMKNSAVAAPTSPAGICLTKNCSSAQ